MAFLSFVILLLACFCFAISCAWQLVPNPQPPPWYGRLVVFGLFLWSLSEVILRWPH
jgi:hypothetical protein